MSSANQTPQISVVVIGRNEGDRLLRCFQSIRNASWLELQYQLIYVDSRSTDRSVALAEEWGAQVYVVADPHPNAAKARNLGWQGAVGEFVLFLDGDTELAPDFVRHAMEALGNQRMCAAWGHRRESRPEQSLYTRVLDLDWVYPVGETLYFGGDVLVRRAALAQVNGFDPTLNAGEEPELCARLRAAGWRIEHIDAPMTRHDLAVTTFQAYWLRAYRSGIAYAEVTHRMRLLGDPLWQHEAGRDLRHALLLLVLPVLFLIAAWAYPVLAWLLVLAGFAVWIRTTLRCRWKAPGQLGLCGLYAVHVYVQKVPALCGQLRWYRAHRQQTHVSLVDYKAQTGPASSLSSQGSRFKALLSGALTPVARLYRMLGGKLGRLWHHACLQEGTGRPVDSSNVILGSPVLQGTRNITIGRNCLIYPGVYLETQGTGSIELGDEVVLSSGVHIVAFERVVLGSGCMVGEYSSIRDANHNLSGDSIRYSGHSSAPIVLEPNVWIGRGVCVLKGVRIGRNTVVGANAVVTHSLAADHVATGIPARERPQPGIQASEAETGQQEH